MASESLASSSPVRIKSSTFKFEVDYHKTKDLPIGESISFPPFTAGGYDWTLEYYPRGDNPEDEGSHASLYLHLTSERKDVTAECSIQLLDRMGRSIEPCADVVATFGCNYGHCLQNFFARDEIENIYLVNGTFLISCNIRVITEPKVVKNYPGGLSEHIEKLWEKKERFDVTFEVEGENISAHRFMLAARSLVFEANFFGSMAETKIEPIKIYEMKAEIFKALLHFIYTDQLVVNGSSDDETLPNELLQDLFVAADRYALDKLTLLCEEQLSKNLSVETVLTTLHLADRHSCASLKSKCLEFASDPQNLSRVAVTKRYLHIMTASPSLFAELCEKVESSSHSAKKQRTN